MKLIYRGIGYDYKPSPVPELGPVFSTGTYRGAPVEFRALAEVPQQPSFELKWRGVPYRSGLKATVQIPAPESIPTVSAASAEKESRPPSLSHRKIGC